MSASGPPATACPPGYRDDNFLLYGPPIPCSLNIAAHRGMFIAWTVILALALLEMVVSVLRKTSKHLTPLQLAGAMLWYVGLLIMCSYVIGRDFEVAVASSYADSTVVWIFFGFANCCVMSVMFDGIAKFTVAAGSLVDLSVNNTVHRFMKPLLYTLMCAKILLSLVTLGILVHALEDPAMREMAANAYAIGFGAIIVLLVIISVTYCTILRKLCTQQIAFLKGMPNADREMLQRVRGLRIRLRMIAMLVMSDIPTPLLYFVIGGYLRWRYETMHVVLSFTCLPVILLFMVYTQSPLLRFIWARDWTHVLAKFGVRSAGSTNGTSPSQSTATATGSDGKHLSATAASLLELQKLQMQSTMSEGIYVPAEHEDEPAEHRHNNAPAPQQEA